MALDDGWMVQASCRQFTEKEADRIFFPPSKKGMKADYSKAKEICEMCPVRRSCLAFAIAHNVPHGVWGGRSPDERADLPRERKVLLRRAWWRRYPRARPSRHLVAM